ncbi:hypothetical protein D3C85_1276040 [compost metagenome]
MRIEQRSQLVRRGTDGGIHADPCRVALAFVAHEGVFHAPGIGNGLAAGRALGAQAPEVGRVLFITTDFDHTVVLHGHDNTAAHTAIRTDTAHRRAAHTRTPGLDQKQKSALLPRAH